jgi:hypothetical protein
MIQVRVYVWSVISSMLVLGLASRAAISSVMVVRGPFLAFCLCCYVI